MPTASPLEGGLELFKRRLFLFVLFLVLIIVLGMVAFSVLDNMKWQDALFATIASIGGAGFKSPNKLTVILSGLIMILEWACVWLIFENVVKGISEGKFTEWICKRRTDLAVKKLKDHYVLIGYGRVGSEIAGDLKKKGKHIVIIDRHFDAVQRATKDGFTAVQGDVLDEKALTSAGIPKAKVLIAALGSDADNVFVTLSAKHLNPKIRIIARAEHDDTVEKLKQAGATQIMMPSRIGGKAMADAALKT